MEYYMPGQRQFPDYKPAALKRYEAALEQYFPPHLPPKHRRHRAPDWNELEVEMRLGEYTEEPCKLQLFGCYYRSKNRLIPQYNDLRSIQYQDRRNPVFYLQACDSCWKVKLAEVDNFKAKNSWVLEVSHRERISPANLRKMWDDKVVPDLMAKMEPILVAIGQVLHNLSSDTNRTVIKTGELLPPIPQGTVIYIDIEGINRGHITIVTLRSP